MYLTRFGLQRRPFPATPDTTCYYPATGHELALARLARALEDEAGFALLVGDAGTGKTLLCHVLLERSVRPSSVAFLTNTHLSCRRDLLQAILYDLSLTYDGSEQDLRLRLTDHVLAEFRAGRRTLLVIDEAHLLSHDVLEELRLLSNLEAGAAKAVQVVLAGQTPLLANLRDPALVSLSQRVAARVQLQPLGQDEAVDYLLHHTRAAGGQPDRLFTDEALALLAEAGRGLPRMLNQIAHQALLTADALGVERVDAELVLNALEPGAGEDGCGEEPVTAEQFDREEEPGTGEPVPAAGRDRDLGPVQPGLAYQIFDVPRRRA